MASRSALAKRNIAMGLLNKACTLLLPFVTRTVLIYTLGVEYVGLTSLFTSLLSVLSLAELGVGTALVYAMYKPIADGDDAKVRALLALYRRWYRIIGAVILAVGLCLMPFLNVLVSGEVPADVDLRTLYGVYLANTVLSYFMFAYKQAAFTASQRSDMVSNVGSALAVASALLQIAALLLTRSFYVFALVLPLITIAQNVALSALFDKRYPQYRPEGALPKAEVRAIGSNILGLMIQKIGTVFLTSVDSIVISAFLGLAVLGVYNNYWTLVTAVVGFTGMIASTIIPSVGNSIASEGKRKNFRDFRKFDFIYTWLIAWCGCCLMALSQPFVEVWLGEGNMLDFGMVALLGVVFFTNHVNDMTYVYRDAAGLWRQGRFVPLVAAIVNLAFNIALVNIVGLPGVAISSIVALLAVYTPFYTKILFLSYFDDGRAWLRYVAGQFARTVIFTAMALLCSWVVSLVPIGGVVGLVAKFAVILVLPNLLLLLAYGRTEGFRLAKPFVLGMLKRRFREDA